MSMIKFDQPEDVIQDALASHATPFYIYDSNVIEANTENLVRSMENAGVESFKNFFAVKALPNPHVLKLLSKLGHGFDCSSGAELELARMVGAESSQIMFTSNNTTDGEFEVAHQMRAIINFDDLIYVERYLDTFGLPEVASCRYNPGEFAADTQEIQKIIGRPDESKFGMSRDRVIQSYKLLKQKGVTRFGLHTMLLSNNLSWSNHAEIAKVMFELAADISQELDIDFEFINLGGGIGVAYHPDDEPFDYKEYAKAVKSAYINSGLEKRGHPRIVMENGRCITASAGWLVTKVQNVKESYKKYIGVDASMADLMRPGMYGAYHHITVLGSENNDYLENVDIVGSLCENNDKFARDRKLPSVKNGDVLVIHTTGAHGHSMGFNYNGRLRPAELLANNGEINVIRRAETLNDLFRTITPLQGEMS